MMKQASYCCIYFILFSYLICSILLSGVLSFSFSLLYLCVAFQYFSYVVSSVSACLFFHFIFYLSAFLWKCINWSSLPFRISSDRMRGIIFYLLSSAQEISVQKISVLTPESMCFYCVHRAELRTICSWSILPKYLFKEKTQAPLFRAFVSGQQHMFHSICLLCTALGSAV